jgi:hypothetical protein
MCYHNQTPGQQTEGDEAFFTVGKAVVFEGDATSRKHLLGILEAQAMFGEVLPSLLLVPFVFYFRAQFKL